MGTYGMLRVGWAILPDATRSAALPGASYAGRALPVSESFGTLRYGRLAENFEWPVAPPA